jgi:hypothetical protein
MNATALDRNGQLCWRAVSCGVGHRWSVTASWFTSDKTCGERHATPFVERLGIDCDRLLRERLWKLYGEGQFGRLRGDGAALLNI